MTAATLVDIRGLSVRFGHGPGTVHAVRGIDLHVDRGETLAVVGESGSGKSVTTLALMRLVEFGGGRIDAGEIQFRRPDGVCKIFAWHPRTRCVASGAAKSA